MKTAFDTDAIVFSLLKDSDVAGLITGGFYVGDGRPMDSVKEDVVINSIALSQEYLPQVGVSNVNVYAPDISVSIGGKTQMQANRARLKVLSDAVVGVIRGANITGLKINPVDMAVLGEPVINQHYVNIRINWNIQTN